MPLFTRFFYLSLLFLLPAAAPAQAQPPPASLRHFFCQAPQRQSAWTYWLEHRPAMRALRVPQPPDFSEAMLNTTPSVPGTDPFAETLRVYESGVYQFGISGAKGFNLRNIPRNLRQWIQLLRLRNLLHLRQWIQPESDALRLQNLVGASFYFYF